MASSLGQSATVAPPLIAVTISPEARVKAEAGEAPRLLSQGQWREFSIEIKNTAGITAPLRVESEQIMAHLQDTQREHWLRLELIPADPLNGQSVETRTLRLWSRDVGTRVAVLNFNAGQGTQDLGFRSDVLLSFKISPQPAERSHPQR